MRLGFEVLIQIEREILIAAAPIQKKGEMGGKRGGFDFPIFER